MRSEWLQDGVKRSVLAPISLIVSAFAPVIDARRTLTPELDLSVPSELLLIDLGAGQNRLGGSCFAQVWNQCGGCPADLDEPGLAVKFFAFLRALKDARLVRAYHDRSDGGALQSLLEMSFASRCALAVDLGAVADPVAACFAEEPGAVLQVALADTTAVMALAREAGLAQNVHRIATPQPGHEITVCANGSELFRASRIELHRAWSETSFRMQTLRDNPQCAREEFARGLDPQDPGLHAWASFDVTEDVAAPFLHLTRPALAVLREQGVNSQTEMAQVCTNAGFDAFDVHMTDILSGRVSLSRFQGLVACGGFSYGDVLGAGEGWAKSILFNARARAEFAGFFARPETFTLGVCNGCQMLSALKELIPGAATWPRFVRNRSEQYEARLSLVKVPASASVLFAGMHGSVLPIAVSHGEGRAEFEQDSGSQEIIAAGQATLQFVDHYERVTDVYPFNPNGSPGGIAGVTSVDGRATALMPHPERVYRTVQNSWRPAAWGEDGAWTRLFRNARVFLR
jgi:phosphoribosylformylglycinamidine synthase